MKFIYIYYPDNNNKRCVRLNIPGCMPESVCLFLIYTQYVQFNSNPVQLRQVYYYYYLLLNLEWNPFNNQS